MLIRVGSEKNRFRWLVQKLKIKQSRNKMKKKQDIVNAENARKYVFILNILSITAIKKRITACRRRRVVVSMLL